MPIKLHPTKLLLALLGCVIVFSVARAATNPCATEIANYAAAVATLEAAQDAAEEAQQAVYAAQAAADAAYLALAECEYGCGEDEEYTPPTHELAVSILE